MESGSINKYCWYAIVGILIIGILGRFPGLAILMLAAYILLAILCVTLFFALPRTLETAAGLVLAPLFLGSMFKLMHWPAAGIMLLIGTMGLAFVGVLALIRGVKARTDWLAIFGGMAVLLQAFCNAGMFIPKIAVDQQYWYGAHGLLAVVLSLWGLTRDRPINEITWLNLAIVGVYGIHYLTNPIAEILRVTSG